jgi:FkbM family methyltransferase
MSEMLAKDARHLAHVLQHHGIDLVLDVGANVGQYVQRLRRDGYAGRIVSFEPLSQAHAELTRAAESDPLWAVAPRLALGDSDAPVRLNISAESDMSSVMDFTAEMAEILDSSAYVGTEVASQARLEAVFGKFVGAGDRVLLKVDTQGTERRVLEGARGVFGRLVAIQTELSLVPVYKDEPGWLEMVRYLHDHGFDPVLFIPGYFNRRTARLIGMDGVFVRRG